MSKPKTKSKKPAKSATQPKEEKTAPKAAAKKKEERLSTKTMAIYTALTRPDGATVDELAEVTGWQKHSVRGFLSTQKKKREDFALEKFTRGDGKTAYKIDAAGDSGNG